MDTEELIREKIANLFHNFQVAGTKKGQDIFAGYALDLYKKAGYVRMADDQGLPEIDYYKK